MSSIFESIYATLPLLCTSLGADQSNNCLRATQLGFATQLSIDELSNENVHETLFELIANRSKYMAKAQYAQRLMKLAGGIERGVHLIEEFAVIGYEHGQLYSEHLPLWQRWNLDLIAFFGFVLALFYLCVKYLMLGVWKVLKKLCTKKEKSQKKEENQKKKKNQ